jgi:O-antigen/teichoic acid export membrane protein
VNSVLTSDPAAVDPPEASIGPQVPSHVTRRLLGSTSALGASIVVERGASFLANILAARLGGASTFGAYSLAITAANNISTYAAGGIGSTAARFSGKYPMGTPGYRTLGRVLIIVSVASAVLAAGGLWLGAAPIAHLLRMDGLTSLLRWSALSAAGIILLECMRGFLLGHGRHAGMLLLSLLVGIGMLLFIPMAALRQSPTRMIVFPGCITSSAVVICLLLAAPIGLLDSSSVRPSPIGPMLREVWTFGFIQLAGLVGLNLAGWWMTSLVARISLVQMSFFAIASQLRNIVALAPTMLTESSYAVMSDREGEDWRAPSQVMALCTFASTIGAFLFASLGLIILPWALPLLYGHAYDAAAITTAIAFGVAVVHMGAGPAAARLTIVSIRSSGIINTVWALFVGLGSTAFLLSHGSAGRAMAIYLGAHLLSSALVLIVLSSKDYLPAGMVLVFLLGSGSGIVLTGLSIFRTHHAGYSLPITLGMVALSAGSGTGLVFLGKKHHWLPPSARMMTIVRSVPALAGQIFIRSRP